MMDLKDSLQNNGVDTTVFTRIEYPDKQDDAIYLLEVPKETAIEQWEILRRLVPETGYWPVIGENHFEEKKSSHDIIEAALTINVPAWFDKMRPPVERGWGIIGSEKNSNTAFHPFSFTIPHLVFPTHSLVPWMLFPTNLPWKVPAYLQFWNASNDPQEHVAVMKYWYERYGAELVGLVGSTIEFRVASPPTTFADAYRLAEEQYLYCPDLVDQNVGSLQMLARLLINSPVWWFWWD